jgi:hypothetical protein
MPKPYIGVQIRNTDYKSDPAVVAPILKRYTHSVYLATDSVEAQRYVRAIALGKVWTSPIPDFGGKPLHLTPVSFEEKFRLNRIAIEDLIMLSLAENVYVSNARSGFACLAQKLNGNQRVVIGWFSGNHVDATIKLRLWFNYLRSILRVVRSWSGMRQGRPAI